MSPTFEPTPGKILGTMPCTVQGVREECLDATEAFANTNLPTGHKEDVQLTGNFFATHDVFLRPQQYANWTIGHTHGVHHLCCIVHRCLICPNGPIVAVRTHCVSGAPTNKRKMEASRPPWPPNSNNAHNTVEALAKAVKWHVTRHSWRNDKRMIKAELGT